MLDLGWTELAIIAVIALMVIGPKDLPKVLRTLGQWTRRLRGLAREFQGHIDDVIRDSELEDVRDGLKKARRTNIGASINKMVDPDGTVTRDLNDIGRRPGSGSGSGQSEGATKDTLDYDGAGDPTGPARGTAAPKEAAPKEAAPKEAAPKEADPVTETKTRTNED